ncbi:unnamed protein product, partial [Litomosoides sigmodontis]
ADKFSFGFLRHIRLIFSRLTTCRITASEGERD